MNAKRVVDHVVEHNDFVMRYSNKDQRLPEDVSYEIKSAHYKRVLSDLLRNDAALFLERYHLLLWENDQAFSYFHDNESLMTDYETCWYVKQMQERREHSGKNTLSATVRNRRYAAMQHLMQNTDYFSMENLQVRDPELYRTFVGDEVRFDRNMKVYERLLYNSDLHDAKLMQSQRFTEINSSEDSQNEDRERPSESEEEEEVKDMSLNEEGVDEIQEEEQTDEERERYHSEFLEIMQRRFLSGEDKEFDYSSVDAGYGAGQEMRREIERMEDQDLEDRYFDSD